MKKLLVLITLLSSCTFLATNPAVDAEIVQVSETILEDLYQYETGKTFNLFQQSKEQTK